MDKKVLVATLLCDRKAYSQHQAPLAMALLDHPCDLYFNIQTSDMAKFKYLTEELLPTIEKKHFIDTWDMSSSWWNKPQFDQDQARLFPICVARNMAVQCALDMGYDYLFFVDADVVVPKDSLTKLLNHDKPIISGLVRGRGCHKEAFYVFHPRQFHDNGLIEVAHATCGFTLIKREVFEVLRFRSGPHPIHRETHLSEDPAFGADAECIWKMGNWWVDRNCISTHCDDPDHPLTEDQTSQY